MLGNKQQQRGGENSVNLQAEEINIQGGLSYTEVRQIAMDIFEVNFIRMSESASKIATERAIEITEKFLDKLMTNNPQGIIQAQNPNFQYSLYNAQKEYAKSGDKDLEEALVNILLARSFELERGTLQVLLNEAINVIPKLTQAQLNLLSIYFIFTKLTINLDCTQSIDDFISTLETLVSPLVIEATQVDYEHMQYCGCVGISMGFIGLDKLLKDTYGRIFSRGISYEEIINMGIDFERYKDIFVKSFDNPELLQINVQNESGLIPMANKFNIDQVNFNKIQDLYSRSSMNEYSISNLLREKSTIIYSVYNIWNNTSMKNIRLTTMGTLLAKLNLDRFGNFLHINLRDIL